MQFAFLYFSMLLLCLYKDNPIVGNQDEGFPLDHLTADFVVSATTAHGQTLIVAPERQSGGRPVAHLYLFDHKSGLAREIQDGRIVMSLLFQVGHSPGGFTLADGYYGHIYFLDSSGGFLEKTNLNRFNGFNSDHRYFNIFFDRDRGWTTNSRKGDDHFLSKVNMTEHRLVIIHSTRFENEEKTYWFPAENSFFQINPQTAEVLWFEDDKFENAKTLFEWREPVMYRNFIRDRLVTPIYSEAGLFLTENIFFDWDDRMLKKPRKGIVHLALGINEYRKSPNQVPLAKIDEKWLIFDIQIQEFRIE